MFFYSHVRVQRGAEGNCVVARDERCSIIIIMADLMSSCVAVLFIPRGERKVEQVEEDEGGKSYNAEKEQREHGVD